ncbi:hypothetical protein KIH27_04220 [Mycobacterium sp. M1]|uniref:Uncharacterized protein n=1 Tax=Mycolicibacter acidiphilus TaxID=2835306 RepID=A0ABS5RES9_9MYCO|nr:hypothetical protein [Mycolicibacter acidiphilus]MBS9532792.1 hypothetical protein [Mycolicibacter acidiphilus]
MTHEPLRVDPVRLAQAGEKLEQLAQQIPQIKPDFSVSGSDPLTAAIGAKIPELEEPVTG